MGHGQVISRLRRLATKSPRYIALRLLQEVRMESERVLAPAFARSITGKRLARWAGLDDVDALWTELSRRPYPVLTRGLDRRSYDEKYPGSSDAILGAAERAIAREINLLGTGPVRLSDEIDWLRDFKTGDRWPQQFCRSIDYVNRGRSSDVKVPWELSRLQWLLPVGQAYVLSGGDEKYAEEARDILLSWMAANPYAYSVNWCVAMESALRIQSWIWLFHVFATSTAWADPPFRERFLAMLYLHGAFTKVHIERSSINGNHLTADAAGLVFAGLFFGGIGDADHWADEGWRTLEEEILKQVHPDGVDFEASVPYHRLVAELFVLPARYRKLLGKPISPDYSMRLRNMAQFTLAYSRPDGTSPVWGDADDGRALPLGTQPLSDHRYLVGLIGDTVGDQRLLEGAHASDELAWHGISVDGKHTMTSTAFRDGGFYILANADNHVFIDCGPIGLAGLGGHGHNDVLSFEAWLAGGPLVVDPGSYVYTADFAARNRFRSTQAHNTVLIDNEEINRFYAPDNLWNLHEDAKAELVEFVVGDGHARFVGCHHGYERLPAPSSVQRIIELDFNAGALTVCDTIETNGTHEIAVSLHFAPEIQVSINADTFTLTRGEAQFTLTWEDATWHSLIAEAEVSPSYGVRLPTRKIVWKKTITGNTKFIVKIRPLQ